MPAHQLRGLLHSPAAPAGSPLDDLAAPSRCPFPQASAGARDTLLTGIAVPASLAAHAHAGCTCTATSSLYLRLARTLLLLTAYPPLLPAGECAAGLSGPHQSNRLWACQGQHGGWPAHQQLHRDHGVHVSKPEHMWRSSLGLMCCSSAAALAAFATYTAVAV